MNREHGNKPQKHKPRVHNQTIKKRKGVKPGFKQRGNMVYLHRLPNNNPSNSGEQMNLVPGEVKLKTKIRRLTPQTELDNMDRKPQCHESILFHVYIAKCSTVGCISTDACGS